MAMGMCVGVIIELMRLLVVAFQRSMVAQGLALLVEGGGLATYMIVSFWGYKQAVRVPSPAAALRPQQRNDSYS